MAKFQIQINVDCVDFMAAQELNVLTQNAFNKVDSRDMVKLLQKVKANPAIVKTALKFI